MRAWLLNTYLLALSWCVLPVWAVSAAGDLTSENLAKTAFRVAQETQTTGYCYAAVSKAVRPFDISLHGAAAYEARDLLLKDSRFVPLSISSVDYLRRGDIVVFNKSASHPYGHISVYQGNETEASDHIAKIASSQPYGGATVFRLRDDWSIDDVPIRMAPDFASGYPHLASYPQPREPEPVVSKERDTGSLRAGYDKYGKATVRRMTNILIRRCVDALLD